MNGRGRKTGCAARGRFVGVTPDASGSRPAGRRGGAGRRYGELAADLVGVKRVGQFAANRGLYAPDEQRPHSSASLSDSGWTSVNAGRPFRRPTSFPPPAPALPGDRCAFAFSLDRRPPPPPPPPPALRRAAGVRPSIMSTSPRTSLTPFPRTESRSKPHIQSESARTGASLGGVTCGQRRGVGRSPAASAVVGKRGNVLKSGRWGVR